MTVPLPLHCCWLTVAVVLKRLGAAWGKRSQRRWQLDLQVHYENSHNGKSRPLVRSERPHHEQIPAPSCSPFWLPPTLRHRSLGMRWQWEPCPGRPGMGTHGDWKASPQQWRGARLSIGQYCKVSKESKSCKKKNKNKKYSLMVAGILQITMCVHVHKRRIKHPLAVFLASFLQWPTEMVPDHIQRILLLPSAVEIAHCGNWKGGTHIYGVYDKNFDSATHCAMDIAGNFCCIIHNNPK